jgi:hypothetical protein
MCFAHLVKHPRLCSVVVITSDFEASNSLLSSDNPGSNPGTTFFAFILTFQVESKGGERAYGNASFIGILNHEEVQSNRSSLYAILEVGQDLFA